MLQLLQLVLVGLRRRGDEERASRPCPRSLERRKLKSSVEVTFSEVFARRSGRGCSGIGSRSGGDYIELARKIRQRVHHQAVCRAKVDSKGGIVEEKDETGEFERR